MVVKFIIIKIMNLIIHEIHPEQKENLKDWGKKLIGEKKQGAIKTLKQAKTK